MKKSSTSLSKDYIKRTIWIGFAFFGILLVWQLYNAYCAPMLTFMFAKFDYRDAVTEANLAGYKTTAELLAHGYITREQYLDVQWKVGIIMALDNIAALFIMPIFGNLSDKTHTKLGKRMPYILIGSVVTAIALPFIPLFFVQSMATSETDLLAFIIGMVAVMVVIIIFMMTYRSPAVSLMPDLTPKPLRSKANGIINIVGYVGGAIGSIAAIVVPVTKYIDGSNKSLIMLEIPFIVCSICLLLSNVVLLVKIKENKLHEQLDKEIADSDALGESAEKIEGTGKLSRKNKINLLLILASVVLWFMSLNAIETFQTNYVMFWLNTSSSGGAIMTVVSGAASILGFLLAGPIADKIGRKWTIFIGICVVTAGYLLYSLTPEVVPQAGEDLFTAQLPFYFYILLPIIGFGTSLIHICSFPLVTDYCGADKVGRYTSYYYVASMLAQSITPICIGFIFTQTSWQALPIYSTILMACAGLVFIFVQAPKHKNKAPNAKGLEALGSDD